MASVKVTDLRRNLLAYLARARCGERLEITAHGKVLALIVAPVAEARAALRGTVLQYNEPLMPAFDPREWEMNR